MLQCQIVSRVLDKPYVHVVSVIEIRKRPRIDDVARSQA
jgi:hypothetical protein